MTLLRRFSNDERGAAVIEMAFALPAFIIMLWAVVQFGLALRAMAGIQHSLGEGARAATIYPYPDPTKTTTIQDKMNAAVYGIGPGTFKIVTPTSGTADGSTYLDLKVTYVQPTSFLIMPGPTISVTRSKRVWVAETD